MVCKNCGADLKPGIKYCLNCGTYIDDDDDEKELAEEMEEVAVEVDDSEEKNETKDDYELSYEDLGGNQDDNNYEEVEEKPKKQRKKVDLSLTDMLIYGGLLLVIIVSLIIIFVTLTKQNNKDVEQPTEVKVVDHKVSIDNYTITFSGKLNYNQEKKIIYITDKENYTFSYRNKVDDYKKYATDLTILSKDLKNNGCNVISTETKKEGSTEFIIYKYKMSNETKYLYITPLKDKYVTMGVIDMIDGGQWENALTVISGINSNIKFNNSDTEDIDDVINNSVSDISKILK